MRKYLLSWLELCATHQTTLLVSFYFAAAWILPFRQFMCIEAVVLAWLYFLVATRTEKLDLKGKEAYLKAALKSTMVQRVGLLLVSGWTLNLFALHIHSNQALLENSHALQDFHLLEYISPLVYFASACLTAMLLRLPLKKIKQDEKLAARRRFWAGGCFVMFAAAWLASLATLTLAEHGPLSLAIGWFFACLGDANFLASYWTPTGVATITGQIIPITTSIEAAFAQANVVVENVIFNTRLLVFALSTILLLPAFLRLSNLLTAFCWRVLSPWSPANIVEAFVEALHMPGLSLKMKSLHPWRQNICRSLFWLFGCAVFLFGFFYHAAAFEPDAGEYEVVTYYNLVPVNPHVAAGADGKVHVRNQGYRTVRIYKRAMNPTMDWMNKDGLPVTRWQRNADAMVPYFLSADPPASNKKLEYLPAIYSALMATVPFAIMTGVFLPYRRRRRLVVNADGLSMPDGPYWSWDLRQSRLWSDLSSVSVCHASRLKDMSQAMLVFKFKSGGSFKLAARQMSGDDFGALIGYIDEHATGCTVSDEVLAVLAALAVKPSSKNKGGADDFQSTVFVPLVRGQYLPGDRGRIVRQLATKPLCAVYLARLPNGQLAVVKQFHLSSQNQETEALAKTFQREFELLQMLDHPGISKVIASFAEGADTFLVIEHRPGKDLRSLVLEHGPRSEAVVTDWAQQLCQIMIYLHSRQPQILHRDLTPDNLIVGDDGCLRLIDFGAARQFLEGITKTMIGKQCYMAPEQIQGDACPASDIYAFGCTLNFLLTGNDPLALSQSNPQAQVEINQDLSDVIKQCTEYDQVLRPQSFNEIAQRLAAISQPAGIRLGLKEKEAVA